MATAVIQIDGATGSRSDLTIGVQVNLNDAGTGAITRLWEFLSRPPGSSATLNNPTSKTPDFTPDVVGSYRIRLVVNSSVVDIAIGAVRTTNLSLRIPATGEEDEFDESGNTDGWSSSVHEALVAIDTDSVASKTPTAHAESHQDGYSDELTVQDLGSGAAVANRILVSDGSGGWTVSTKPSLDECYDQGRYIFVDSGPVLLAATDGNALQMDGYLTLVQILEPGPVPVSGLLYTKNLDGYVELFFKDNYGYNVQITSDGYLDTFDGVRAVGLFEQDVDPTQESQKGFVYSKDDGGTTELFFMDNYGVATQITNDGYLDTFESVPGIGMFEQSSDPSPASQKAFVYSKDGGSGSTELFFMDSVGIITQITSDGYLNSLISVDGYDELSPYETTGTETSLSLSEVPMSRPDMPSGFALDVYVNGQKMRHVETLDEYQTEWIYNAALNRVEFLASDIPGTWYCARYKTVEGADPLAPEITTIFDEVVLDQDRTSTIVNKGGRNTIAFDVALTAADGYSFGTSGTVKVIAGNSASLDGGDALEIPQWSVVTDGYAKLELETGFAYIGLFFEHISDDGYGDTISANVAVS